MTDEQGAHRTVELLGYARTTTHHGVTIERGRGTARVTLPPVHFTNAMIVWAVGVMYVTGGLVYRVQRAPVDVNEVGTLIVMAAGLLVALALIILSRRWRRLIEVTPTAVRVGRSGFRSVRWHFAWRRAAVGEIKYNPLSGELLVRITGKDMQEFPLPGHERTKREIAEALQAALAETPESGATRARE